MKTGWLKKATAAREKFFEPHGKCPLCGSAMVLRQIKNSRTLKGAEFYGCSTFPKCKWARFKGALHQEMLDFLLPETTPYYAMRDELVSRGELWKICCKLDKKERRMIKNEVPDVRISAMVEAAEDRELARLDAEAMNVTLLSVNSALLGLVDDVFRMHSGEVMEWYEIDTHDEGW